MNRLNGLNRTIIGLKAQLRKTVEPKRESLNRTIIGLKGIPGNNKQQGEKEFESNYYRIESCISMHLKYSY